MKNPSHSKRSTRIAVFEAQEKAAAEQVAKLDGLPIDVLAAVVEQLYKKYGPAVIRISVAAGVMDHLPKRGLTA